MKLTEIRETRFKKIREFRKHSPLARQAINKHKEEVALWGELVVEDCVEIVADLIMQPFIYAFKKNAPTDLLGQLIVTAEPEN